MREGRTVTLCAVGDISPGDHFLLPGCGIRSTFLAHRQDFLFRLIREKLRADIVFGNLEGVLSNFDHRERDIDSSAFRGVPEMASAFREAGFTLLNVANNHALQHGQEAFDETIGHLRRSGIIPLGVAEADGEAPAFRQEIGGQSFAFVATSWIPEVHHPDLHAYVRDGFEPIVEKITRLAKEVDHVIVSVHHGLEGIDRPSPYEALLFRRIIDAGARVILGHHSHVLQAIERYRQGIICHGLGNFIFDLPWYEPLTFGAVIRISFGRAGVDVATVPFRLNSRFQPVPLAGTEERAARKRIENLSVAADRDFSREGLEKASYDYYLAVRTAEKKIACRKMIFLLRTFFRGDWRLRTAFVTRKIGERCAHVGKAESHACHPLAEKRHRQSGQANDALHER